MEKANKKVIRGECLFHGEDLGYTLDRLLTIIEEDVHIHDLEPCQKCLNGYGHDEIVHLHCSIKTVYDALRMIHRQFKQLHRKSGRKYPRSGPQPMRIDQTSEN
jgi:hypothetical protein